MEFYIINSFYIINKNWLAAIDVINDSKNPAGIYVLKVNNRNTRTRCEISSKLIIKTPKQGPWRRSGVFIVNFEDISHLVLVFLLLTFNIQLPTENASYISCKLYCL